MCQYIIAPFAGFGDKNTALREQGGDEFIDVRLFCIVCGLGYDCLDAGDLDCTTGGEKGFVS